MKKGNEAIIIFPHQLFKKNPILKKERVTFLIEAPRYFTDFSFHKTKLMLHRASMKAYADYLEKKGYQVFYIDIHKWNTLFNILKKKKFNVIHYIDPVDIPFENDFLKKIKILSRTILKYETPAFLSPTDWLKKIFEKKDSYFMQPFYVKQRKRLNILLTKNKKPLGGKWSYDDQNRKTIPENLTIPKLWTPKVDVYVKEAKEYIEKHFSKNPGTTDNFIYPVTFIDAQKWFRNFLKKRFKQFGPYEDAIIADKHFLFHSVLSPLLNIGLLTPDEIVDKALIHTKKHKTPINSIEGFIRQIIGWREFVRAVYIFDQKKQRKANFFHHHKKLPKSFWNGSTNIEPIDVTIHKTIEIAYVHHIERLMILGNFMLLCGIKPENVFTWFMELFIDAYDWVMVPNVYGMSQFADGGLMTTKPYISGSNYILSMSDYSKNEWSSIWDALYWHFLYKHKKKLSDVTRMNIMYLQLKKMKKSSLNKHLKIARNFLKKI